MVSKKIEIRQQRTVIPEGWEINEVHPMPYDCQRGEERRAQATPALRESRVRVDQGS